MELAEKDKKYIWHPFTQMKEYLEEENLIIAKGEGNYLIDINGKRYFDGVSSLWCNVHGHRKKEIDEAIKSQVDRIAHSTLLGHSNVPSIKLAEKLVKITPLPLKKVFYSEDGAEAVEIALKISFQYWKNEGVKRERFISLKEAYHGDTLGAMGVGGIDIYREIFDPLLFRPIQIDPPYCYRCPFEKEKGDCNFECISAIEEAIEKYSEDVCAVILESGILGAAGMIPFPDGYLRAVSERCKKNDVLLILDEVATGFGRTGKMFGCEHERVSPDLLAIGKGLTGGYLPLAATMTTKRIYDAFLGDYDEMKQFHHGHTYTGNPIACAAAIANLEVFEREKVIERLKEKIEFLEEELKRFYDLPHVGDVRQKGFMVGIELVKDRETKERFPMGLRIGFSVARRAIGKGVFLRPLGDIIVLMPPLSTKIEELKFLCDVVYEGIDKI
ncbi:MAG: adenosylmethionine--8-amino-7-oxononanoate transaminase [Candidatus Syntropharchaeia archaeon]